MRLFVAVRFPSKHDSCKPSPCFLATGQARLKQESSWKGYTVSDPKLLDQWVFGKAALVTGRKEQLLKLRLGAFQGALPKCPLDPLIACYTYGGEHACLRGKVLQPTESQKPQ